MRERQSIVGLLVVLHLIVPIGLVDAVADDRPGQSEQDSSNPPPVTGFVRNWTRLERTSYFQPPPDGGNHQYGHISNRLRFRTSCCTTRARAT